MAIDAGTARVLITGDYSKLASDFAAAQGIASSGAQAVGAATEAGYGRAAGSALYLSTSVRQAMAAQEALVPVAEEAAEAEDAVAGASGRASSALAGTANQARLLGSELRVLSGQGGILAAERFLAGIPGLAAISTAIFPLLGMAAVLELVSNRFGKTSEAEKKAAEDTKKLAEEWDKLAASFERGEVERAALEIGRLSSLKLGQFYADSAADRDRANLKSLQDEIQAAWARMRTDTAGQSQLSVGPVGGLSRLMLASDWKEQAAKAKDLGNQISVLTEKLRLYDEVTSKVTADQIAQQRASEQGRTQSAGLSNQERALDAESRARATLAGIEQSQAHASVQIQIDAMHDRQAATVAEAAEEVRVAQRKEADVTSALEKELPKRLALIRQQGAASELGKTPEELPEVRVQTAGKLADEEAKADQKVLEAHAATISAEQKLDEANATHAREMFEYVRKAGTEAWDEIGKSLQSFAEKQAEAFSQFVKNANEIDAIQAKANARAGEITAKGQGEDRSLEIERQKIQAQGDYNAAVGHTAQQQIAFARQIAGLDAQSRNAKIDGLKAELSVAQQAESANVAKVTAAAPSSDEAKVANEAEVQTRLKVLEIQNQINAAILQGDNAELEAQEKILALIKQQSLGNKLGNDAQQGVASLTHAAAGGIVDGKNIGKDIRESLKGIGKEMLGDVFEKAAEEMVIAITGNTIATNLNTLWTELSSILHIPGFATGGSVAQDMVAQVHKGEYVLNADQVAGRAPLPDMFQVPGGSSSGNVAPSTAVHSISSRSSSSVNSLSFGDVHFHGVQNTRQMMKEISDLAKTANPTHSPFNN